MRRNRWLWVLKGALDKRRNSKHWNKTAPEAIVEEYRNKYKFVDCSEAFEAIVVQYFPKLGGIKNPEDHVVLYAPKVPAGCPSHFFSLCRSQKKRLSSVLKLDDRVMLGAYKVTGRPRDFCKVSDDGLVQIMPKLEAKKVQFTHWCAGTETNLEPAIIYNVFEHRFWLEAERRERELKRPVGMEDLKQKHVMHVKFLDPQLKVRHSFTPHATNVPCAVGNVIDYGPISAIKGTETARLQRRFKRRKGLSRLILETNFMCETLARMRMMPAGALVGSGFIFPPSFDKRLVPRTKEGRSVKCSVVPDSRPAIVRFDVASPNDPLYAWMHKDFATLASETEENRMKGFQFNERKIEVAGIVSKSEEHRRMVLASERAVIAPRERNDAGGNYTFELVFDIAKVDPYDVDACKENTMRKSAASMWEKGSIFRVSEDRHIRPFAEGCVLKMKRIPEKVRERIPVGKGKRMKTIYRLTKMTLRVTADIWARNEDEHFSSNQKKLHELLNRPTKDALFMPDLDRTEFEQQIKTFGKRKLWATFNDASLNPIGQILRDIFCWSYTPQTVDTSDTELRRREEQARFDEVQLDNLKTMVASKGRACMMDAPTGTGKTDLCTEFIAESLSRDWVEYGVRQSFPVIVFKSNANLVNAIRIMQRHIRGFEPVLLVSTSGKERLDDCDITPEEFDTFSSRSILRDLEGRIRADTAVFTDEDRAFLEDYHAKHDAHPLRSYCEQKALGLLLKYYKPSAIFATCSTLEVYADVLCDKTTHMLIDDGGQFDVATVLCLLCKFPKLEQVIISGDSRQPNNYLKGIPEELWKYGHNSVMDLVEKGFPIAVSMNCTYRFDPMLSEAVSYAAYDGTLEHAVGYPPTPDPDWRRDLLPLLPNPDTPILLVDVRGRHERPDYGTSQINIKEQEVVSELVDRLRDILDGQATIAVLSPYTGQKIEIKNMLEGYNCFVRTVDSFVGQVADIVILSTVQSWDETEDDVLQEKRRLQHNAFFKHTGRALSAISRPVHAIFVVGNMEALEVNAVYRRFLEFSRRHTSVMRVEYCLVTFCPPDYALYVQAKASHPGLLGIAYSDVSGHVALLEGDLQYEVGKVYKVRITRIDQEDVAQAVGTLLCISVGSILDVFREVHEEDVHSDLLDQTPWPRKVPGQQPATAKGTKAKRSTHSGQTVSSSGNNHDDLKLDTTPIADHHYEGTVYDVQPLYVRVYVPQFRISAIALKNEIHPAVGALLKFRLKDADCFIARLHVPYQAIAVEEIGTATNDQLLEVRKILENAPNECASDAHPRPSTSSKWGSVQGPRATRSVKLEGRPEPFAQGPHALPATVKGQQAEASKPTFAPPEKWNFTSTDKKATDLLGVAIAAESGTTTFYTRLGPVKIPAEAQLGVWVRMDVMLTDGPFANVDDVLRIEQLVPPPMDTRVIRGKRVMLAAEVEKHPDGVGNEFLGAVLDPLSLLPRHSSQGIFVAELEFEKGCFHVIKYHKPSSFGVPATVPLEESAYPFPEDHRGLDIQEGIKEYADLLQLQHDI